MDAKNFLRNKSIFSELYVYSLDDESFELSQLLTEYAKSLQLIQPVVNHQRELLKAFQDHYQSNLFDDEMTFDWNIDNFLKAFNCG